MGIASNRYRFAILAIGLMCLTSIGSNYIIINFTFICMREDMSEVIEAENGTFRSIYDYTQKEKSAIIWAVAAGTIVGTFPINYLYIKFGARYPFLAAGIVSVISTFLIPITAKLGLPFLVFIRFLQGLAYSADFAAIGLICVRWAPLKELAIFIALLTAFTPISAILTNVITGFLCTSSLGWRSSYYLHGTAGIIAFSLWFIFYKDDPQLCKRVSKKELMIIQTDKSADHIEHKQDVPYKALLTSPVILCVWLNAFCEMTSMIMLSTYTPIYFRRIFEFPVETTGILTSLTTVVSIPFKLVSAYCSDHVVFLSEKAKINIFNTIAIGVVGVVFCMVGFIPLQFKWVAVIMFSLLHAFSSCNCGGFYKCGTLHARQHAHVVIATIQFMKCVALFTGPALVSSIVHDESNKMQWAVVFSICGTVMILVNLFSYAIFTDKPASWTTSVPTAIKEETPEVQQMITCL
ncbi:Membrane transporter [Trichostrongylus colubriformis]|uniref:Membrane transporter n=1 Tax=Trichostrongylus colubriformis TaxID=6319 RepID=A0AAN8II37_TRICO